MVRILRAEVGGTGDFFTTPAAEGAEVEGMRKGVGRELVSDRRGAEEEEEGQEVGKGDKSASASGGSEANSNGAFVGAAGRGRLNWNAPGRLGSCSCADGSELPSPMTAPRRAGFATRWLSDMPRACVVVIGREEEVMDEERLSAAPKALLLDEVD